MRLSHAKYALALLMVCLRAAAQTPPPRQIDIGAADAPLSDTERVDLDAAVKKHDYAAEKKVIDKALGEHPNSFELLVMAGRLAYLEKKPKDAADALTRADKIKTIPEQDRLTLALALEFTQDSQRGREELLKLLKIAPQNAEYLYLLGRMDERNQNLEQAVNDFTKAIQLDPNLVRAYEDLGNAQQDLGRFDESRKTFEKGAAVNRKLSVHWEWSPLDLGVAALKANEYDEAEKLFRESLEYRPRFAWGHYYMGQLFQKKERHDEAIAEYKEAVVDDPRLRQAWLALGREFARQGDKVQADRAIAIFKKLEEQQKAIKEKPPATVLAR